jgi:hypothetical protein
MAVVKHANFGNIGVRITGQPAPAVEGGATVTMPSEVPLDSLPELTFRAEAPPIALASSTANWTLDLNSMTLHESFEGFIANMFKTGNEVYFSAIAWDYGGAEPTVYPPKGTNPEDWAFRLKKEGKKAFLGDGVGLWGGKPVVGALNLVILIFESDQGARQAGEVLVKVHDAVAGSKLKELVLAISAAPQLATGVAVAVAVNELVGVVGKIMKNNQNDFVDQYEGSWRVHSRQKGGPEEYDQEATSIQLTLTV